MRGYYRRRYASLSPEKRRELHVTISNYTKKSYRKLKQADPQKAWAKLAYRNSKTRAKKKRVPHDLTFDYILSLVVDKCPVFGCDLVYSNVQHKIWNSATLDRIVPELGYVTGNVQVISSRANSVKNDATPEELMKVAQWAATIPQTQASPMQPG